MTNKDMVAKFQCPGCVFGSNVKCGEYSWSDNELSCVSHVLGTQLGIGNTIALGLPKGFCKPGFRDDGTVRNTMHIRLYPNGTSPDWDNLNIPVWAMWKDGFLFVRTFAPRINMSWVDVIEGGTMAMVPNAIDVSQFVDSID